MTEISQMIRWNTTFIRGLAQSVLERAKEVRVSLKPAAALVPLKKKKSAPKRPAKSVAARAASKKSKSAVKKTSTRRKAKKKTRA